jgi:hypothetical protein
MTEIKAGTYVELHPKGRDVLRRVGIVCEDSTTTGYFEVWQITSTAPDKFELYSVSRGSYNLEDEGRTFVRLDGPGKLSQGIAAQIVQCEVVVDRVGK